MHGLRDQGERVDQQGNHVSSVFGLADRLPNSEASHDFCVQPGQNLTRNQAAGLPVACATRQPSGGNRPRCDPRGKQEVKLGTPTPMSQLVVQSCPKFHQDETGIFLCW
jgi:hypothetical protein